MNKASVSNSIMNVNHTMYVIADAKAFCSIVYSSENVQVKSCWGPENQPNPPPPVLSYIKLENHSLFRGLNDFLFPFCI